MKACAVATLRVRVVIAVAASFPIQRGSSISNQEVDRYRGMAVVAIAVGDGVIAEVETRIVVQ